MPKKLIVCLGNPGLPYQRTRHNVGWLTADFLAQSWQLPAWTPSRKFQVNLTHGLVDGRDVILAQPTTFMNNSGLAARALVDFYRLDAEQDFLLIYDDLDLPLGRFKLTTHPPRTHNGLHSVQEQLGRERFWQVRVGIDDRGGQRRIPGINYVLGTFEEAQLGRLRQEVWPALEREVRRWL